MAKASRPRTTAPVLQATTRVAVAGCGCGFYPLEQATHRTSGQAWQALAAHVALNPTKCDKLGRLFWDDVPAGLAAGLPMPTEPQQSEAFAVVV